MVTVGESMALFVPPARSGLRDTAQVELRVGGAESNTAIALARLGLNVRWVSRLGQDPLGDRVLRCIRAEGVDTGFVHRCPLPTGLYLRDQTPNGAHTLYYRAGSAASTMNCEDFPLPALDGATWLHLTGITPALSAACGDLTLFLLHQARQRSIPVSFDVNFRSRLWSAEQARLFIGTCLPFLTVLLTSEEEAQYLWGTAGTDLMRRLQQSMTGTVVLKRGQNGSELLNAQGQWFQADAYPVQAIETTGAGDAFNAGFLAGYLGGATAQECLRLGNALGAWCVSSPGDAEGLPDRAELAAFLSQTRPMGR